MNTLFIKYSIICILFISLFTQKIAAQEFNDNDKSYFKVATRYYSDVVYSGRKDSIQVPYIEPSLSYFHESGLFISTALAFNPLSKYNESYDRFTLDVGYEFSITDDIKGGVYYSKYNYNANSQAISSELRSDLGIDLNYTKKHWQLSGGAYLFFSGVTDSFTYVSLAYNQEVKIGKMKLFILPKISSNQGTQKLFNNSKAKRLGQKTTTITGNGFNVLDYEVAIEFNLDKPTWGITLEPYYAIPINPALLSTNRITGDKYETLSHTFFTQFSVYLKF